MINRGKCWPASARSSNWRVQARGGAGHADSTWRQWMEPVRPRPSGTGAVGQTADRTAPRSATIPPASREE